MSKEARQPEHTTQHETTKSFVVGFVLSIILTLAAYFAVVYKVFGTAELIVFILVLAFVQLAVQLLWFLHLGREPKPRWNLQVFLVAFSIIFVVVVGSIWIMTHLNYNMLPSEEMLEHTMEKEAIHR